MLFSLNECVPTYAVLSLFFFREPLGASSDPAGSESLPALLQHCITKAKGGAANNNNNTTSVRGTGLCRFYQENNWNCVAGVLLCVFPPFPGRCVPLSDPAAIPDTPRGRGSQPPQKEETSEKEESLSLFDLPPAPQAVRGGPDRHPGQCRLRGSQLRHPPLTACPPSHWTRLNKRTDLPPPHEETPDLSLRRSPQTLAASPVWGGREEGARTTWGRRPNLQTRTMAFLSCLSPRKPDLKTFYRYIMYIHSKTRELRFLQQ